MVIVCDTVAVLPAQSVAVQVRVTVPVLQVPRFVLSTDVITGFGSQLSVAVGAVNTAVAGHWIVASSPCPLSTGAVVSSMVMVCDTVAVLPAQSVAVQVRVTVPVLHVPRFVLSTDVITGFGSQLSVAVGAVNAAEAGH